MGTILMKMAVLLQGHAFCAWTAMDPSGYFFFEKPSLIDFQIGKGHKNVMSFGSRHFTWFERCEVSHCTGQRDPCNG